MNRMKAFILPPSENYLGNMLWSIFEIRNFQEEVEISMEKITNKGYWASCFPEGDGVTFRNDCKNNNEILIDFRECFEWLDIEISSTHSSIIDNLAKIDAKNTINCTITVPLTQIRIEESFKLEDNYKYLANEADDTIKVKRVADFKTEQIEFNLDIEYGDLLKLNSSIEHNNYVINRCLDLAERGMDIIRLKFSSFLRPEFTPNPAGQLKHGFYAVQITPNENTPVKPKCYSEISKPLSASNNWLGPEVWDLFGYSDYQLSEILLEHTKSDLGNLIISSLRNCRHAFYSLGEESKFLSLIFSIDGLTSPDQNWSGKWKHRTYIAALACENDIEKFENILERYDYLYSNVRNKLVHQGESFYQLEAKSEESCEELWSIYKDIIYLILRNNYTKISEIKNYAKELLSDSCYRDVYSKFIIKNDNSGKPSIPDWSKYIVKNN